MILEVPTGTEHFKLPIGGHGYVKTGLGSEERLVGQLELTKVDKDLGGFYIRNPTTAKYEIEVKLKPGEFGKANVTTAIQYRNWATPIGRSTVFRGNSWTYTGIVAVGEEILVDVRKGGQVVHHQVIKFKPGENKILVE